jgi:hypothetical protein
MNVRRKVNFYELTVLGSSPFSSREYLLHVFSGIKQGIDSNDKSVDIILASKEAAIQFRIGNEIKDKTARIFGKARFIKFNEFQETYRLSNQSERSLADDAASDEGVTEETHFVIDVRYERPIIGIETSQSGPKVGNIKYYLDLWLGKTSQSNVETNFEPIIGRRAEEFVNSIRECAALKMKVRKENIPAIQDYHGELGTILNASQNYAETDYVDLLLGYQFRVKIDDKPDTSNLIRRVKELIRIDTESNFFTNFEVLEIRAQEGDEPIKPFDLIAEKTAVEVFAERKSDRIKHFNSQKLYNDIGSEIGKNFGPPQNEEDVAIRPIPPLSNPF